MSINTPSRTVKFILALALKGICMLSLRNTLKSPMLRLTVFSGVLIALPVVAAVDPSTHKLCVQAKDYAGCVKAMTTAPAQEEDSMTPLRNSMKQVAGRLSFGTSLADSTSTIQPVIDQLALAESKDPNSLAVKSAREAVQLFDILQTAWRVRIQSENIAFRGISGDLRVYNCRNLKASADAFDAISSSGRLNWSYNKGFFGDTCKVNYGQEPDALMYPIIIRILRDGAISSEEIRAREKAEQERNAQIERERELCALGPWNRYLEQNPGIRKWAIANPEMAEARRKKFIADPSNKSSCSFGSNWSWEAR